MSDTKARADLTIIEKILEAIQTGRFPALEQLKEELLSIRSRLLYGTPPQVSQDSHEACETLETLLHTHKDAFPEAKLVVLENALEFLTAEMNRFAEIKKRRPLTDEEKRIGQEYLIPLADSITQWLGAEESGENRDNP